MKNMNRKEGKKIGIVMTAAVLLTIVICTSLAAAAIDSFTITPQKGMASRADAYSAVVTSSAGFNEINITIPARFGALAPTTGGQVVARVDLFNTTEARAYYGYVELKSNGTNPGTKVDVTCDIGGDVATLLDQDIDYSAGGVTPITSPFAGGGTLATLTMPTATVDGTFCLDLSAIPNLKIKMATVDTGLFVRNPIADTYTFDADGTTEDVTITWPTADCAIATYNAGWWAFKYGPVDEIPDGQDADKWLAYGGAGEPVVGDFNNDGNEDIAMYDAGWWAIIYGPVNVIPDFQNADKWLAYGGAGEPVVGDFDANGVDDIAMYNAGWWAIIYGPVDIIPDSQNADQWLAYGGAGEPVVGDFDANGVDDIAMYNAGWWAIIYGPVDIIPDSQNADQWLAYGGAGEPVVGDFDANGVDDIAMYNAGWWPMKYGPVNAIANFQGADKWLSYGGGAPLTGDFNP